MSRNKPHPPYRLKDGTEVPSVTTILGMLSKPALIQWAWNLGRQGKSWQKARDNAANIGTIAHEMIRCHLEDEEFDASDYTPRNVKTARNSFKAFMDWQATNTVSPIVIETPMVSERHRFGGAPDLIAETDTSGLALIDFKTSKDIYPEMRVQLAAYAQMAIENGYSIATAHILRIDEEKAEFVHYYLGRVKDMAKEWRLFKFLSSAYPLWVSL